MTNRPADLASDRDKVRGGWAKLKGFQGVMGMTSINKMGEGLKEVYMLKVDNGKWVRIK